MPDKKDDNSELYFIAFIPPAPVFEDALKLKQRCDRLRELINMEELESWTIAVERAMQAAWQRIPW